MKIKLTIPETLSEITLEQFQKYYKLTKDNEHSEFVNQKTIEIFCNIELKEVAKINYHSVNEILNHFNSLFQSRLKHIETFKLNGITFGFEPNLDKITTGVYVDAESYLQDIETLHKAMAVLYRPITSKSKNMYEIEPYESSDMYQDIMKQAPLDVALGMQVFFYDLGKELLIAMNRYLQQGKLITEQEKQLLEKSGVGINLFMQQLREIFSNSIALQNYQYTNY
jgi:hypothetical protein